MMRNESQVKVYERDGNEYVINPQDDFLKVCSHWNDSDRVVLSTLDGSFVTVLARDLIKAVQNCTNV